MSKELSIEQYRKLTKKSKPKQNNTMSVDEFKKLNKKTKHLTAKQIRLIREFEEYLTERDYYFEKEIVYSKLFPNCKRLFRCDYLVKSNIFEDYRCIIEINGMEFGGGRHTFGKGYQSDLTKMNIASYNRMPYFGFTYTQLEEQEYVNYFH